MRKQRKLLKAEAKVCLPEQEHVLRLTGAEYDLLADLFEYLWDEDLDDLREFSNEYRYHLYGDDWTPDVSWTKEKFGKVFESLSEKRAQAAYFGKRDAN